jgi:hypothetical protein
MYGLHNASLVKIRGARRIKGRPFPETILTKMIFIYLGRKWPAACGAEGRGYLRKTVKTGLTKEEFPLIPLCPVFPEEFFADRAPRWIDEINESADNAH